MKCRRTYWIWKSMRQRCRNPKNKAFHKYGARGITVCERWDDYELFVADMGNAPTGMSLDRKDNSRGYEKDNCRWATPLEQGANTRQNRMLSVHGETLHLSEWARRMGIKPDVLWKRLKRNPEVPIGEVIRIHVSR